MNASRIDATLTSPHHILNDGRSGRVSRREPRGRIPLNCNGSYCTPLPISRDIVTTIGSLSRPCPWLSRRSQATNHRSRSTLETSTTKRYVGQGTHSLTHSLIHSLTHSPTHSLLFKGQAAVRVRGQTCVVIRSKQECNVWWLLSRAQGSTRKRRYRGHSL